MASYGVMIQLYVLPTAGEIWRATARRFNMTQCLKCQQENPPQAMVCEACGVPLWDTTEETVIQKLPEGFPKSQIKSGWGTSTFEPSNHVIIHVRDHPDPIFITPTDEFLLGRHAGINGLDLTPFG